MKEQNLIKKSNFKLNPELARKAGKIGGKRSVEVKKQKKKMKEQLELLMSLPLKIKERKKELKKDFGILEEDTNNQMAVLVAVFKKALRGDVKAAEFIRDTLGEKPKINDNEIISEEELLNAENVLIKIREKFTNE